MPVAPETLHWTLAALPAAPDTFAEAAALCSLAAGLAWLALVDIRYLEISPPALAFTIGGVLATLVLQDAPMVQHVGASLAGLGTALAIRALRAAALGAGDIGLFALMGLAAGPDRALPLVLLYAVSAYATALIWLHRRGKPLSRFPKHVFPAAPAASIAIAAIMVG